MALKFTFDQMKEALIDRFYGVNYEDIQQEYGISKSLMKKVIHQPRLYRGKVYGDAFRQALKELKVTHKKYVEQIHEHATTRMSKSHQGLKNSARILDRGQVYEILHVIFSGPMTSAEIARTTGFSKSIIHRIRHREAYQDITEEYIQLHRIQHPAKYLENGPNGRGKNGYPEVTDDHVRRFFYFYMAGATRQRAMVNANISHYTMYALLSFKHPTKNDLMLQLILSEGFTPSSFKKFVRKKDIRTQQKSIRKTYVLQKRLQLSQER